MHTHRLRAQLNAVHVSGCQYVCLPPFRTKALLALRALLLKAFSVGREWVFLNLISKIED